MGSIFSDFSIDSLLSGIRSLFSDFGMLDTAFVACAAVGGFFVFTRFIMQLIGADADTDVDDVSIDGHHAGSDHGFHLLSLHGLSSFFMMFGLVGLALLRQSKAGIPASIVGAVAAGLVSVWIIGKIFTSATRLQSSGTLQTSEAVGCEGTVYLTIPKGGTGRVTLNISKRLCEFDAVEGHGEAIATGTQVRVVEVNGTTLTVEPKTK